MTNHMSQSNLETHGAGFRIDTFDELWTAIGRLPFASQDGPFAWRGVPDDKYRIVSSLYRSLTSSGSEAALTEEILRAEEVRILGRAREWGLGGTGAQKVTDLQLLAQLQHHGVPTRLLDVTANPLTALWFACQEPSGPASKGPTDGLLIAFNLDGYQTVLTEDTPDTLGKMANSASWDLIHALEKSAESRLPFVVRPSSLDARMSAQEGFFIASSCPPADSERETHSFPRAECDGLHLRASDYIPQGAAENMLFESEPISSRFTQALWCFVIPNGIKPTILKALERNFNRSARTLFPDYAGFKQFEIAAPDSVVPQSRHNEVDVVVPPVER